MRPGRHQLARPNEAPRAPTTSPTIFDAPVSSPTPLDRRTYRRELSGRGVELAAIKSPT